MNQGDLGSFQGVLEQAYEALKKSTANLKHIIVFSDGDPGAPTAKLMQAIVDDRITVSTRPDLRPRRPRDDDLDGRPGQRPVLQREFTQRPAADLHQGNGGDLEVGHLRRPVQAAVAVVERTGARHRRDRVSQAARLRGHDPQAARRDAAVDRQGRPAAGALAVRPGPRGGLHLRRQSQVGQDLAELGQIPAVLVADRAMEHAATGERGFHHRRDGG